MGKIGCGREKIKTGAGWIEKTANACLSDLHYDMIIDDCTPIFLTDLEP